MGFLEQTPFRNSAKVVLVAATCGAVLWLCYIHFLSEAAFAKRAVAQKFDGLGSTEILRSSSHGIGGMCVEFRVQDQSGQIIRAGTVQLVGEYEDLRKNTRYIEHPKFEECARKAAG